MDEDGRKIGMVIAAFDEERQNLKVTIGALTQIRVQLQRDESGAAREAAAEALKSLHFEIHKTGQALRDLQQVSLWRAALQHAVVALMAIAVTFHLAAVGAGTACGLDRQCDEARRDNQPFEMWGSKASLRVHRWSGGAAWGSEPRRALYGS